MDTDLLPMISMKILPTLHFMFMPFIFFTRTFFTSDCSKTVSFVLVVKVKRTTIDVNRPGKVTLVNDSGGTKHQTRQFLKFRSTPSLNLEQK